MATNKKYSNIDLSKYSAGYKESQDVINAQNQKLAAENAVKNYGDFNYGRQDAYDQAINALTNREKFKYDLNGDALYQQYKDQYITQGKQAMMDTMGQASALTGGYGNSYAATVGNQTYQGYLQQLNNKIPELYQLALDKYNSEGDQLAQTYGVLAQDRQNSYGEWGDKYNRLVGERDYSSNEYNNAYNRDYTTFNDNRSHDTTQYWNEYSTGYQADRDAIADAQWQKQFDAEQTWKQKEFDEAIRQYNEQMALQRQQLAARSYSGGGSGGDSDGDEGTPKPKAQETEKTKLFRASIRTKSEYQRLSNTERRNGGNPSSYEDYVKDTLERWVNNGKLTEAEGDYLVSYYNFK